MVGNTDNSEEQTYFHDKVLSSYAQHLEKIDAEAEKVERFGKNGSNRKLINLLTYSSRVYCTYQIRVTAPAKRGRRGDAKHVWETILTGAQSLLVVDGPA